VDAFYPLAMLAAVGKEPVQRRSRDQMGDHPGQSLSDDVTIAIMGELDTLRTVVYLLKVGLIKGPEGLLAFTRGILCIVCQAARS